MLCSFYNIFNSFILPAALRYIILVFNTIIPQRYLVLPNRPKLSLSSAERNCCKANDLMRRLKYEINSGNKNIPARISKASTTILCVNKKIMSAVCVSKITYQRNVFLIDFSRAPDCSTLYMLKAITSSTVCLYSMTRIRHPKRCQPNKSAGNAYLIRLYLACPKHAMTINTISPASSIPLKTCRRQTPRCGLPRSPRRSDSGPGSCRRQQTRPGCWSSCRHPPRRFRVRSA